MGVTTILVVSYNISPFTGPDDSRSQCSICCVDWQTMWLKCTILSVYNLISLSEINYRPSRNVVGGIWENVVFSLPPPFPPSHFHALFHFTLCLKKGPTCKLSVTLSNLNRFSKFLHCWKAYKIRCKTDTKLPTSP